MADAGGLDIFHEANWLAAKVKLRLGRVGVFQESGYFCYMSKEILPGKELVIEKVKQFAKDVKKQGVPLRQVFLFGSYARGEQRELSDIDVALVADDFTGVSFEDVKRFIDVTIQKPYFLIELHTFKTSDFMEGNPFVNEIKRTGIRIA
ncbi:MAG: nucleotidyltransferase domain-containing protein [Bacteroidota bacterium]